MNFEKDYPSAHITLLEQNYRSTKRILQAANDVVEITPIVRIKIFGLKMVKESPISITVPKVRMMNPYVVSKIQEGIRNKMKNITILQFYAGLTHSLE